MAVDLIGVVAAVKKLLVSIIRSWSARDWCRVRDLLWLTELGGCAKRASLEDVRRRHRALAVLLGALTILVFL